VRPALDAVASQMRADGLAPRVTGDAGRVALTLQHEDLTVFRYMVRLRELRAARFAFAETRDATTGEERHYRAVAQAPDGEPVDVTGFSREQVINDLLKRYARFRHGRPATFG
jgi:choline/glycine/proline betaine transport protein